MTASARPLLARWIGWFALLCCCATAVANPSSAALQEPNASLNSMQADGETIAATLTVRGATGAIDPATVTAWIDGRSAAVTPAAPTTIPRTTVLAIDTSGSMGETGMAIVRQATRDFLAAVPDDVLVGVVSFSNTAGVDLAPTTDHARVLEWVDGLTAGGNTALYDAVDVAVGVLGDEGERSIMLLSDGGDTVASRFGGQSADDVRRAAAIESLTRGGIRVEVVAFRESTEARAEVLAAFAEAGGGSIFDAGDGAAVAQGFRAAAQALSSQLVLSIEHPGRARGEQRVLVSGSAGATPFTARATIDLGLPPLPTPNATPESDAQALGPPAVFTPPARTLRSFAVPVLASSWILLGAFVLVVATLAPVFRTRKAQRLSVIEAYRSGIAAVPEKAAETSSRVSERAFTAGDRFMRGRRSTTRTLTLIERADLALRPGEWLGVRIASVLLLMAVGYAVLAPRSGLAGVVLGGVAGSLLPAVVLRVLADRRARRFEEVLPDVMLLVAANLTSGFSLLQALDSVAGDAAAPADKEFSRALAQTRIGTDVSDALDSVAVRMGSENLRWTTMAIRIQREVGGNLADTLRTTANTLREREFLKRQVHSLSAEGRLSAYVLMAMPIALGLYMMIVNYDYISLLWQTSLGVVMLAAAGVLLVIGILWMRKIVQIEV